MRVREATLLGQVESVTGTAVAVRVDPEALSGLVYVEGETHRIGQVGSLVRLPQGFTDLYGVVTQAGVAAAPTEGVEHDRRWLTVDIVGEAKKGSIFSRGVHRHPTIGDEVHLVTEENLSVIYGARGDRKQIQIGRLSSSRSVPALIDVNRLVARHSAILGATGSGKSTTVAGLVSRLADSADFPAARILILDIHGEYGPAFGGDARAFRVEPSRDAGEKALCIPYWALSFEEFLSLGFGTISELARGRIADWIVEARRSLVGRGLYAGLTAERVTVDTPLPFSVRQLWYEMRWEADATYPKSSAQSKASAAVWDSGSPRELVAAKFEPNDGTKFVKAKNVPVGHRELAVLASRLSDPRMKFLFEPRPWTPDEEGIVGADLDGLLADWIGSGDEASRPVSILDLSGIPASVLVQLVGSLLRIVFDALFWGRNLSEGGRERPLLIVMEEAHAYLAASTSPAALSVQRIVKEGRKYGVGAMIVSQRPSEIDSTILSQCGTVIALRIGNSQDRSQVAAATSDSMKGILDLLPVLKTGEAVILGEAVHLPTRAEIRPPPAGRRPMSQDPRIVEMEYAPEETGPGGWDRRLERADYSDLVTAWRTQNPRVERSTKGGGRDD